MLKEESIKRRIHLSFDRHNVLKDAPMEIRNWFEEIIRLTYKSLELDKDEYFHSSSENLRFAIEVNLYDEFVQLYEEAKRETSK